MHSTSSPCLPILYRECNQVFRNTKASFPFFTAQKWRNFKIYLSFPRSIYYVTFSWVNDALILCFWQSWLRHSRRKGILKHSCYLIARQKYLKTLSIGASDSWFWLRSWFYGSWDVVPHQALHWQRGACLGFSLSLSLSLSLWLFPDCTLSLKINK